MQANFSLRDALVATLVLSPAFITGLTLPWGFSSSALAARQLLTGGVVDVNIHDIRANTGSGNSGDESSTKTGAAPSGQPTGTAGGM